MSRHQKAGRIHSIHTDNSPFERAEQFKYLRMLFRKKFIAHKVRECLLSFGAECFVFQFAYKNIKIRYLVYRTILLPAVLYESETCSLTLSEERRLGVFENRVLRKIFGLKREQAAGEWKKNYIMASLIICIPHQILFG
jgi:hypothetical protein